MHNSVIQVYAIQLLLCTGSTNTRKELSQGVLLCQGSQQALFLPDLDFPADEEHVILGDTTQSCARRLKPWAPHACWGMAHRQ